MLRRKCSLVVLACAALGAAPAPAGAAPARPFIKVVGTRFMEGDKPFFFVGANLSVMHEPMARARAPQTIEAAARDGMRVARVWALGEGEPDAADWLKQSYLFRAGPKGWQETAFKQLDRVIAEAGKHGLRLVITLSNRWADYGGIPMYLRWAGQVDVESYGYTDRFFTDRQCRAWYLQHLKRVIGRTNSITGVPYRDDPTIMTWELQNEMHGTPEAAEARRRWVADMAREVRKLDGNHLVTPGLLGYNLLLERREWVQMNQLPEVDYCDHHVYPQESLRTKAFTNLTKYLDDRVQLAHYVVRKPIVFGEFGFLERGAAGERERFHRRFLEHLFHDGVNGAMVWIYQPNLPWKRTYGVIVEDPRHRALRRVLAEMARRAASRELRSSNPRLGVEVGDRPLAPSHVMLAQRFPPAKSWRPFSRPEGAPATDAPAPTLPARSVLEIPVERFQRAWFEEAGSWAGGILVHAYGRRTGWFEYRFVGPAFVPSRVEVRARLSSEFPGSTAPKDGFSKVQVFLDGTRLSEVRAQPDDGIGGWTSTLITDPALLRKLRGPAVHTLRFQVDEGPEANGVAIYGREARLNREPVDDPGPLQILADRPAAPAGTAGRR
jgi:mannan endo-1,4-beta-mannosidase